MSQFIWWENPNGCTGTSVFICLYTPDWELVGACLHVCVWKGNKPINPHPPIRPLQTLTSPFLSSHIGGSGTALHVWVRESKQIVPDLSCFGSVKVCCKEMRRFAGLCKCIHVYKSSVCVLATYTYFSRTAWTSSPERQLEEANGSKRGLKTWESFTTCSTNKSITLIWLHCLSAVCFSEMLLQTAANTHTKPDVF